MSKFQINVHSEFAQTNSKQNNPNQNKAKPTDFQKKLEYYYCIDRCRWFQHFEIKF